MRIDQDIHFELAGLPVLAQLDTTAPDNRWVLTPQPHHPEDSGFAFKQIIRRAFGDEGTCTAGKSGDLLVAHISEDHVVLVYEDPDDDEPSKGATMMTNIMISLPDWDGENLQTLTGGMEFADFLRCLEECGGKHFRRSDGRSIEFKNLKGHQVLV